MTFMKLSKFHFFSKESMFQILPLMTESRSREGITENITGSFDFPLTDLCCQHRRTSDVPPNRSAPDLPQRRVSLSDLLQRRVSLSDLLQRRVTVG